MNSKNPQTVDEYIASTPKKFQEKLLELRKLIKSTVPDAEEKISYAMPYYGYHGRLVYFALMKNYIGLYIPPPIIQEYKKELENYEQTKSAVHIPLALSLPTELIKKLVLARAAWNKKIEKEK